MTRYCQDCGKPTPNENSPRCKPCYYQHIGKQTHQANKTAPKQTNNPQQQNKENNKEEGIDFSKEITIPLWLLLGAFIAGAILGAMLW